MLLTRILLHTEFTVWLPVSMWNCHHHICHHHICHITSVTITSVTSHLSPSHLSLHHLMLLTPLLMLFTLNNRYKYVYIWESSRHQLGQPRWRSDIQRSLSVPEHSHHGNLTCDTLSSPWRCYSWQPRCREILLTSRWHILPVCQVGEVSGRGTAGSTYAHLLGTGQTTNRTGQRSTGQVRGQHDRSEVSSSAASSYRIFGQSFYFKFSILSRSSDSQTYFYSVISDKLL